MKTLDLVTSGFDPCFGFRIVPAGVRIRVVIHASPIASYEMAVAAGGIR